MRLAQCLFYLAGRIASCENETKIACSLRQRDQQVIQLRRNLHACNQWYGLSLFYTMYSFEHTPLRNRYHHDTGSMLISFNCSNLLTNSVAQDQFFQADAGPKFQNR